MNMMPQPHPLDAQQSAQFDLLLKTLTPSQMTWIAGYLTGMNARLPEGANQAPAPDATERLIILFASQTGNAEDLARRLGQSAEGRGLAVSVMSMAEYPPRALRKARHLLMVVSTHGDGEPPDSAMALHTFIHGRKAPRLEGLRYAVLALGDTGYTQFCRTGKDFDLQLERLGATRMHPRVDCDVDYEDDAAAWSTSVIELYAAQLRPPVSITPVPAAPVVTGYSRRNPFPAPILDRILLSGRGSDREVHHVELGTSESGLTWMPGDAIGVYPDNAPQTVDMLIDALNLDGDTQVPVNGNTIPLSEALRHHYEITTLTRPFMEGYAALAASPRLDAMIADDGQAAFSEYTASHQIIDLVEDFPVQGLPADAFIGLLRKLPPRLYSIASSHAANPDEMHLTVAAVRYQAHERTRLGVASTYLADRAQDTVPVYINVNPGFRLPEDDDAPIIMIGPGTGVAPFRAFLEEREVRGARGSNWLFFGARHFRTDFLYQADWLRWRRQGLLTDIDTAFSRDQSERIYVQHRMRDAGRKLYDRLEQGAYLYVCGDAGAMARDVHSTLLEIITTHGGKDPDDAQDMLRRLQKEKRYQRDVY